MIFEAKTGGSLKSPLILGVSVIGSRHILNGLPCQDACAYDISIQGWGIIAVADGLGSASKSEIGAKAAVDTTVKCVKNKISSNDSEVIQLENIVINAINSARETLDLKAKEFDCKIDELACTLILIVIHNQEIITAHIGDGAVVVRSDNEFFLASNPGESEYINEVVPLTSKEWQKELRISPIIPNVKFVAAFTDGCQRAVLIKTKDGLKPFMNFFEPLYSYSKEISDLNQSVDELRDFLNSARMNNVSEDDKTLVIGLIDGNF
jgi:hypothetical protein